MARKFLISRVALAVALSSGLAVTVAPNAAFAAKKNEKEGAGNYSKEFVAAFLPIQEADKAARAALGTTPNDQTMTAAVAAENAALGGDAKAAFAKAEAVATTPDDKNVLGDFMRFFAIISKDNALKIHALKLRLDSGKVEQAQIGAVNYDLGVTYYQEQDFASAATYIKAAKDAGYQDPNNQLDLILADSYKRSGNGEAALAMVKADIEAAKASGQAPSETALRSALQAAYDAKDLASSTEYASMLAANYPSPEVWYISASIVRQLAALPTAENLDLMRLMFETKALKDKRDYLEYLENADPRAYPGEALKVMNEGIAKGALTSADLGTEKADTEARVKSDKASLPSQEADASKSGATVKTVMAAGDVFLSYDENAKAETFYSKALGMPGVDANAAALRLGIAQVRQNKNAEAKASFAKVTGSRKPVAELWAAYADSKS
ncbi:hypothetical protein HT136_21955 [Novosphingobium profundi]|uniref:hypothetical protein n=1 Tax=Novosphingobium profundi TaxID=1774954 RepID=UPI001BD96ABC|nr:hypothetical protein [Novosphingobium profundi]MBT0671041.1 hypothetical protein [Novosphingobium profundi]